MSSGYDPYMCTRLFYPIFSVFGHLPPTIPGNSVELLDFASGVRPQAPTRYKLTLRKVRTELIYNRGRGEYFNFRACHDAYITQGIIQSRTSIMVLT
jgi:hypothetical protein